MNWLNPEWLIRRRSAALLARMDRDPSPANLDALERFRASGPRHSEILGRSEHVLRQSAALGGRALSAAAAKAPKEGPATQRAALAASVAFVLLALGGAGLFYRHETSGGSIEAVLLSTKVGEIREVALSDGSKVTLDTSTAVQLEIGRNRRRARLVHGRARFAVSRRTIPFVIDSGSRTVTLDAGTVDVSRVASQAPVELVEGEARVSGQGGDDGRRPGSAPSTILKLAAAPGAAADGSTWTSGRLSFTNAPLASVAAAANRYSAAQIVIADPSLSGLKVTGVYRVGDPAGLARSLAKAFGLRVRKDPRGDFVLMTGRQRRR